MQKLTLSLAVFFTFLTAGTIAWSHSPELIYQKQGEIQIDNPEISQAFYDELKGAPRNYFISSDKDFNLYVNVLVPEAKNREGRYSANIFSLAGGKEEKIFSIDGEIFEWKEFYEPFGREYYLKGPEFEDNVPAGKYKIEVFSADNTGRYVLAVGKEESFDAISILNLYWQIPELKINFFETSVLQFFLTPIGIAGVVAVGAIIIIFTAITYIFVSIRDFIKHKKAKTLLLTSGGMEMRGEIAKLLQKPAYDITVAFITTAAKPEEDTSYLSKDFEAMKEMGFNVQEVDIEDKNEKELAEIFKLKDIIFVAGGNTFYLLKAMRKCNFKKVLKNFLKKGKVYIGASAGSIVAGRTIKTAGWLGDENRVKLKNFKGLNLVPFDMFVHYQPEHAEIIKKKLPWKWQRRKLKILTDQQAILVQGSQTVLIGEGNRVII
jgi:dipeptidase E